MVVIFDALLQHGSVGSEVAKQEMEMFGLPCQCTTIAAFLIL